MLIFVFVAFASRYFDCNARSMASLRETIEVFLLFLIDVLFGYSTILAEPRHFTHFTHAHFFCRALRFSLGGGSDDAATATTRCVAIFEQERAI